MPTTKAKILRATTVALGVALPLSIAAPAHAGPVVSPTKKCGRGYFVVKKGAHALKDDSHTIATLYVTYHRAKKANCLILVRHTGFTGYQTLGVWAKRTVDPNTKRYYRQNKGSFKWYAGPIYLSNTAGKCIDLKGWGKNPRNGAPFEAKFKRVHCG